METWKPGSIELYKVVNNIRKTYNPQLNNVLIFGAIGFCEKLINYESIRQKLSNRFSIIGFDSDVDQVMESIDCNRKESFIIIRAISDYYDGSISKEWQPIASLCAAAFTKTLLLALPETIKPTVDYFIY